MNPETRYTNKVRRLLKAEFPGIVMVKHSDTFHAGIADLHASLPTGKTIWIEFKYLPSIAKCRKAGVTDLQKEYLLDHLAVGVPSYVLIGTDRTKTHMLYMIDMFDGKAYRADAVNDTQLVKEIRWTL